MTGTTPDPIARVLHYSSGNYLELRWRDGGQTTTAILPDETPADALARRIRVERADIEAARQRIARLETARAAAASIA